MTTPPPLLEHSPGHGYWCEHCNGWFNVDHYDELEDGGNHKRGIEFGIMGRGLAALDLLKTLTDKGVSAELMIRARALAEGWEID